MPLSEQDKLAVLQDLGVDPTKFDLDEVNNTVFPKASSTTKVQPVVSDFTATVKATPQDAAPGPLKTFGMSAAHEALPSFGGGLGAAAGMGIGAALLPTGVGTIPGLAMMLLSGGAGAIAGNTLTKGIQDELVPQSMLDELQQAQQLNPKSAVAGSIATMPLGGFNPAPINALKALGTGAKMITRAPVATDEASKA